MLAMEEDSTNLKCGQKFPPLKLLACSGSLDGGGSERQLWQLVSRLDRQRFAPEVYLLHRRGPYLEQLPSDVPVQAFDVAHPAPPRFPPGRISRMQSRHLRQVVQSRGIDVVYDRTFHMSLLTGWALPVSMPRVSVIVSPPSRDLPSSERRFLFVKRWMLARAYRTATETICVSSEVADDAAGYYGLSRRRLTVLHNPVDVDLVRKLARQPCDMGEVSDAPCLRVALIGRFTAEKGHRLALDILRVFQGKFHHRQLAIHLHCVGDGPQKAEIEMLVNEWSLTGRVHLHGYQTNPYPFIAACDLVLVPSRYEGFPNVALEAMTLGVPLLMTDYGATARMIAGDDNQRAVLIGAEDVLSGIHALADRIDNAVAWQARAVAAKSWIEREHAIEPWLEKMMSLLEHAAGRWRDRRPA